MKLAVIACRVFTRDISLAAAKCENICEIFWLDQGLHTTPQVLAEALKKTIAEIEERQAGLAEHRRYDAIVLGYGLCSNGIIGVGSAVLPVVAPRCDDCIALFLGSQEKYLELFRGHSGLYWYNPGWIEQGDPCCLASIERSHAIYAELYGEDNAEYLTEADHSWIKNYKAAGYIHSPVYESGSYVEFTRQAARDFGWEFVEFEGSFDYISRLLEGGWNEEDFLICPPGQTICESFDGKKIKSCDS